MSGTGVLESSLNYLENDRRVAGDIEEAVGRLACGELIAIHNKTVMAVVGDANDPDLAEKLQTLKKDPGRSTAGLTMPFRDVLQMNLIDYEKINDKKLQGLFCDHNEMTARFGALGFFRLPAKEEAVDNAQVPQMLIGRDQATGIPTLQPYSGTGADATSRFLHSVRAYQEKSMLPVMSSLNAHGDREIVTWEEGAEFVASAPASVRPWMLNLHDGPGDMLRRRAVADESKPLGSYPIVSVGYDESGRAQLQRLREGCFSGELIERLFDGYDIDLYPDNFAPSAHPDTMFGLQDLPEKYRDLTGAQLRLGMLATMGWEADAGLLLQEELPPMPRLDDLLARLVN